ncbi:MAG: hypothetical protein Q9185_006959 [Variospora sp. 1 TL-2023]
MPPLAELSVNRPGKKHQASLDGTITTSGKRSLPGSAFEGNASALPSISAIQSMLKNNTELGDIGNFTGKPSRIPRHTSTTIAHPGTHQHQYVRRRHNDYPVGHQVTKSRQHRNHYDRREPSLHHRRSIRTNGGQSEISDSQDQRSNSVTQSSTISRRGSLHPSLLNIRPYGYPGPRPRLPYVYPSRLKRSDHRPYSPEYSQINVSDSALHTTFYRASSNRTGSPLSNSSMQKLPRPLNHGFARSELLLHQPSAAPLSRRHDGNRSPPFLRHAALSGSPLASRRSSFTSKFRKTKASDSGSSGRRAPSPMPLFYDYSEAFEQESFNHTAQRSSLFEARFVPQSDGSSEGYQADVTTTNTNGTKCSTSTTESTKAVAPEEIIKNMKRPSPSQGLKQQPMKPNKAVCAEPSKSMEIPICPSDDDVESTVQRPPSIYDPAPKVIKATAAAVRLSSSSSGSQYSSSAHSQQGNKTGPPSIKAPDMVYERQPKALSVTFNRAASLDAHVRPETCQIIAPMPERSMSSRDSRDRFSRILSVGEDFMNAFPNHKAPMTIQQYLRDRKAPSHATDTSITKELPPLPDNPPLISRPMPSKGKEKDVYVPPADLGRPGIPQRYSSISNNRLSDLPESSRSVRTSILSQGPICGEHLRKFALTPRNSSLFQTMKDLPPLPKEAIVAVPPPQSADPLELPCLFTPLLQEERLDTAVASIKDSPKLNNASACAATPSIEAEVERHTPPQSFIAGLATEPGSTISHASARPWNLDASYPWAGTPPKLEVKIPQPVKIAAPDLEKTSRFRLNIRRASVMGASGKLSKIRPPDIKVIPSQTVGKDIAPVSPPNLTLAPPSPGLKIEAQSFFSDDSSQRGQKSSIRRRLSQIRGAIRAASLDDVRAQANPSYRAARSSKSSSKRSSTAVEINSGRKSIQWKMLDKIKSWFHRKEENIRKWRRKLSPKHYQTHLRAEV